MFTRPLVTIVTPVYMTPVDRLKRLLDSVAAQTLSRLEVILVDDASPDECPQILDAVAANDDRFKVLHRTANGRAGKAREDGMRLASGEFVLFADADDILRPDMCERLYALARAHDADIVACGWSIRDQNGTVIGRGYLPERRYNLTCARQRAKAYRHLNYSLWNKLFRRSVISTLQFEQYEANIGEDTLFNIAALCHSRILVTTGYIGYDYFRHASSATARKSKGFSYLRTLASSNDSIRRTLSAEDPSAVGLACSDRVSLNRFSTGCGWIADQADPVQRAEMWEFWRCYLHESLLPALTSHRLLALWFRITTSIANASSAYRLTWWALWLTNPMAVIERLEARLLAKSHLHTIRARERASAGTQ
jgi:hypothetical protein